MLAETKDLRKEVEAIQILIMLLAFSGKWEYSGCWGNWLDDSGSEGSSLMGPARCSIHAIISDHLNKIFLGLGFK